MKIRKAALVVSVIAVATVMLALILLPHNRLPSLPSPNGYDDLLAVTPLITPNSVYWRTQNTAELKQGLAANSNALVLIRTALKKQWAVPVFTDTNYLLANMPALKTTKLLAQLFCADGHLAELEQRTNDALNAFTDCIEFGQ